MLFFFMILVDLFSLVFPLELQFYNFSHFLQKKELLYNNHTHIDGTKITTLGFEYGKPKLSVDQLRSVCSSNFIIFIFHFCILMK